MRQRNTRCAGRSRGFTFVELLVGMVVVTIVMAAMAVFVGGAAQGWEQGESAQSASLSANAGVDRITRLVRAAKLLDVNAAPGSMDNSAAPAACMFWRNDDNADGKIQFSEMVLLKYDPATQAVLEYTVQFPASYTASQIAAADYTPSPAGLLTPAQFLAASHVVGVPIAHHVTACQLVPVSASSTTLRPALDVVLRVDTGRSATTVYATATLRGPNGEPQ